MRRISSQRSRFLSARVGVALAVLLAARAEGLAQDERRGAALVELAQQAIGGSRALSQVRTLQVTGTFRRVVGRADTEGDFDVFIEVPDKYLRSEKTGIPGQPSTETVEALLGAETRDVVRGARGGQGARVAAPDGSGPPEANLADDTAGEVRDLARDDAVAPQSGQSEPPPTVRRGGVLLDPEVARLSRQAEVSRLLLMWLLRSDTPLRWVGTAQSPDGTADVVEARYADAQPTRLFLESKSHLPLMLQWTGAPARAGGPGARRGGARRGVPQEAADASPEGPRAMTFEMTFSDHRVVDGIRLPFVITRGSNGVTTERWNISRYRVNPSFDREIFTR